MGSLNLYKTRPGRERAKPGYGWREEGSRERTNTLAKQARETWITRRSFRDLAGHSSLFGRPDSPGNNFEKTTRQAQAAMTGKARGEILGGLSHGP